MPRHWSSSKTLIAVLIMPHAVHSHAAHGLGTLPRSALHAAHTYTDVRMRLTRRDALRRSSRLAWASPAAQSPTAWSYERHRLLRVEHEVPVSGLPPALDGLRIGLITDVHHSATVSARDIVARRRRCCKAAQPDLIVLGGDYVTFGNRKYVEPVAELLAPLARRRDGSFAVLGNHDDDRDMPAALTRHGFTVLKDQRTTVAIRDEPVDIGRHPLLDRDACRT